MRTNLTAGTVIALCCDGIEKSFCIDQVIGDGANCIAYKAHRIESTGAVRDCRIKECYPYNAQVERCGTELVWSDSNERSKAFDKLRKTHRLAAQLRNNESVGNNITSAELCEGNGTLYSVMEINHARTYDKDTDINCFRILETVRVLAEVVAGLHNQGYLHLDIKPGNFLVTHKPNTNIWLFDVDSFTSIEDIKAGITKSISFSQQWAAPEQLRGRIDKICPATDIYSIGAVLFEKLMGRPVSNDDIGLFADWDFSEPVFENVNPKIKRHLREIFHKTLAASVKRRYQTAEELAAALKKAADIAREGMPYLISNCPPITTGFIGRQHELTAIERAFKGNTRAVFLHGEGGIGKSVLSIAYASKHSTNYDAVLFVRYKDSLKNSLVEIEIQNYNPEKESLDKKLKELRKLLDPHVLLIIDNFDVPPDKDEYLDELLRYRAHIIFTTRTDFSGTYSGETVQIEVDQMSENELMQLFCRAAKIELKDEQRPCLLKLLETACYNTYVTEILGLQIAASGCSLESLANSVNYGLISLAQSEKVRVQKDGRVIKHTVPDILRILFNIADLSDRQKQVLRYMSFISSFAKVDAAGYKKFTCGSAADVDDLNDMTELGWVRKVGKFFELHPLVDSLVYSDLQPCGENCPGVCDYIVSVIRECCNSMFDYAESGESRDEFRIEEANTILCAFFWGYERLIDHCTRRLAFDWLKALIDSEDRRVHGYMPDSFFEYNDDDGLYLGTHGADGFYSIYIALSVLAEHDTNGFTLSPQELFDIHYIILASWVQDYNHITVNEDPDQREWYMQYRDNEFIKAYRKAEQAINQMPEPEQEAAYNKLGKLVSRARITYHKISDQLISFIQEIYAERPWAFKWTYPDKKELGLPLEDHPDKEEAEFWENHNFRSSDKSMSDEAWEYNLFFNDFVNSDDNAVEFVKKFVNEGACSPAEQIKYITDCLLDIAFDSPLKISRLGDKILKNIADILNITEDLLNKIELTDADLKILDSWVDYICHNHMFQAEVYAALGDIENFKKYTEKLLFHSEPNGWYHRCCENDKVWYHIANLTLGNRVSFTIQSLAIQLTWTDKASWIVQYLIRHATAWEQYVQENGYSLDDLFDLYEIIKNTSACAAREKDVPEIFMCDFQAISDEYHNKMREITGASDVEYLKTEDEHQRNHHSNQMDEDDDIMADIHEENQFWDEWLNNFLDAENKISFIELLVARNDFSEIMKARLIGYFLSHEFIWKYWTPANVNISEWRELDQILSIQESLLERCDPNSTEWDRSLDYYHYLIDATLIHAVVSTALNDPESFEKYILLLFELINKEINDALNKGTHWSICVDPYSIICYRIRYVTEMISDLNRNSWIVEHIIQFTKKWENYALENGISTDALFANYELIHKCAYNAYLEKDVLPEYQQDFFVISTEYKKLMHNISGTGDSEYLKKNKL